MQAKRRKVDGGKHDGGTSVHGTVNFDSAECRPTMTPHMAFADTRKDCGGRGLVFYTNYESRKGRELDANPRATLLFARVAMERQVTIEGPVARVTREESEAYFHSHLHDRLRYRREAGDWVVERLAP